MNDDLKEVLERIDLESLLDREGVDYKVTRGRSGIQLNVRTCPVCGNSQRKVYLNADTGLGNCFAGDHPPGENFNKWKFIRALWNDLGTAQVIDRLKQIARESGWKPKRKESEVVQPPTDWQLPACIPLPYAGKLPSYLTKRGINGETAKKFDLRYCQEGFYRYQVRGDWRFMDFGRSIIIPVYGLDGKMVTFQGRDMTGTRDPKYLFPPVLGGSGTQLYNGFRAMHGCKRVIVGEGAFDVMAIDQAVQGVSDLRDIVSIGTFGKHLSFGPGDTQGEKLRALRQAGVAELTFMWDGEVRATDDAITAATHANELGFTVRIALLPAEKDPNEVLPEQVREAFYKAEPFSRANAPLIMVKRRKMNEKGSAANFALS